MNATHTRRRTLRLHKIAVLVALAGSIAATVRGADVQAQVSMDTTPLMGGSWFLDFQLVNDDSTINTVTISNIALGGGSHGPGSDTFNGGASGTFPNYTLTDNGSFVNQALIPFTAGSSVQFLLDYTNNFAGPLPDTFSWAVLEADQTTSIVSTGLGAGLVILLDQTVNISAIAADDAFNNITPQVNLLETVPEPSTVFLVPPLLALLLVLRRRWRNPPGD